MTKLEKLKAGMIVRGIIPHIDVTVVSFKWRSRDSLVVKFLDEREIVHAKILSRGFEDDIQIIDHSSLSEIKRQPQNPANQLLSQDDLLKANTQLDRPVDPSNQKDKIQESTLSPRPRDLLQSVRLVSGHREKDKIGTALGILNLSIRSFNALMRSGIFTVEHLTQLSDEQIRDIQNIGQKSYEEIREKLLSLTVEYPELNLHWSSELAAITNSEEPESLDAEQQADNQINRMRDVQLSESPILGDGPSSNEIGSRFVSLLFDNLEPNLERFFEPEPLAEPSAHDQVIDEERIKQLSHIPLREIGIERLGLLPEDYAFLRDKNLSSVFEVTYTPSIQLPSMIDLRVMVKWYLDWIEYQNKDIWIDEIEATNIPPYFEDAFSAVTIEQYVRRWLRDFLSYREYIIVCLNLGLFGSRDTLEEIANALNITGERVKYIKDISVEKLKVAPSRIIREPLRVVVRKMFSIHGNVINQAHLNDALEEIDFIKRGTIDVSGILNLFQKLDGEFQCAKPWNIYLVDLPQEAISEIIIELENIAKTRHQAQSKREFIDAFYRTDTFKRHYKYCMPDLLSSCIEAHPNLFQGSNRKIS